MAMGKQELVLFFKVAAEKAKKNIKEVGDGLKKVGTGGKTAQKGLNFMSGGLKKVGLAIKAAGIGLLIGVLSQLTGLFSQNQKTSDTFARIMLKLKPIFDALGKAIEIVAGFLEGLIDIVSNVIGALFGFSGASNDAANALVEQRNKVKLLTAELALLQLEYQREAEIMRQIRDDESKSIEERIQANFELGKVLAEQLEEEKRLANESLRLAEMELAMNKDNIDLQTALIDAKTKMAEIEERITGQRSEQLTNLNSLERERDAQAKEAAARREEQLKKEAEMLQELIDKQNEDIVVKKEAYRTINEQFDNAEEANKEQIRLLEKKKKEELANLKISKNSADQNIQLKQDELANFEESNQQLIQSNQDKADNFEKVAQEELKRMGFNQVDYIKTQEDLITFQDNVNKYITKELGKVEEEFGYTAQEMADSWSPAMILAGSQALTWAENIQEKSSQAITNIERLTRTSGEEIIAITDDQIAHTQSSLDASLVITDNYESTRAGIIAKYDQEIQDTKESLGETNEQLQEQADEKLFLHFETTQQKEIRLAKLKYSELLGAAEGNAEMTQRVKDDEVRALEEIEQKYIDAQKVDKTELDNFLKVEAKNNREKEIMALEEHLAKVLAIEGLSDEDRLLAEEEFNRRKGEINSQHDEEEIEKGREKQRELEDMALQGVNLAVKIAGESARKELSILDKKFENEEISEEQYIKQKNAIEQKQAKKERNAALLQIGVDTARGISAAVKAGSGVPFPGNIAAIGSGILAVLSGIGAAKAAMNDYSEAGQEVFTEDEGGTDDRDTASEGGVPQITFGAAGSEQAPVQAYVVETDISNAQALQSELDLQSSL